MKIPKWASAHLNSKGANSVSESIASAESKTSGEIVAMIVHRSSTVGHVPVVVLCILTILFLALDLHSLQDDLLTDQWLWLVYALDIFLLLLASSLLSRFHFIQRHLTAKADLIEQVIMRSELEFYESDITNTQDATGIFLYVSLMEHRAVVLADKAIKEKVPDETWSEVCSLLTSGIKKGDMGQAFTDAIKKSGEILTPHFPIKDDDINELSDHLIIKE